MKRVVVVGGGIAGLTVAYRLRDRADVTVVEERDRLGGVIVTDRDSGFLIEGGPDSLLATKPAGAALCKELGLPLIAPRARTVHVLSRGRLHALPEGLFLTAPTRAWPFLSSPLLSLRGRLRAGLDLVLPRGAPVEDESLGSFVRRRFGREMLDKVAEPLMAGIYMAGADDLSLRATFPRFADLERDHRSVIRGLRRADSVGTVSPFVSLEGGMGTLVSALVRAMPRVRFRAGVTARTVAPGRVTLDDGTLDADAVVVAVPPPRAAELLRPSPLADAVARIRAVGSTTVSLGFRGAALPEGTGFVIPRAESRRIVACTWSSRKFEGRAAGSDSLVRCFLRETPPDAVATALDEVRSILGIAADPIISRAYAWPGANPVYEVGHLARVREIDALTPPGLFLTGSGFRGIGLPDGIADATRVAERVSGAPA